MLYIITATTGITIIYFSFLSCLCVKSCIWPQYSHISPPKKCTQPISLRIKVKARCIVNSSVGKSIHFKTQPRPVYIYIYIYIIFIGSICFKLTVIGIARYSIIHVVFFVIKYFFVIKVYICLSLEAKGTVRFSS